MEHGIEQYDRSDLMLLAGRLVSWPGRLVSVQNLKWLVTAVLMVHLSWAGLGSLINRRWFSALLAWLLPVAVWWLVAGWEPEGIWPGRLAAGLAGLLGLWWFLLGWAGIAATCFHRTRHVMEEGVGAVDGEETTEDPGEKGLEDEAREEDEAEEAVVVAVPERLPPHGFTLDTGWGILAVVVLYYQWLWLEYGEVLLGQLERLGMWPL